MSASFLNDLNGAKRLNDWNDWNGLRYCLARGIVSLEIAFRHRKASAKPLDDALYPILRWQIKKLPWSDPGRVSPVSVFAPWGFYMPLS